MLEKLKRYLATIDADYADMRYERVNITNIVFNGDELTTFSSNETDGYVIRVLKEGGFASISVTKEEDIGRAILQVMENCEILARESPQKVSLTYSEPVQEDVQLVLDENPREVPLDDKLALLKHYNAIVLATKNIQTTTMSYLEVCREKFFVNTRGSSIHEPLVTAGISGAITAKKGNVLQNGRVAIGGSDGFASLRKRDDLFQKKATITSELLDAEPVKGGTYTVVLDPEMTGVFVHEAFGHYSEADLIEHNPSLRKKMKIGAKLGSNMLTIVDDPTRKGQLGYYVFDDEGVRARPVTLMENGVLSGRLHSMRTASAFNAKLTGHCVAEDFRYEPIVRMGCIYIERGKKSLDELFADVGNGLYVLGCKGGETCGENFTFGAQYAYRIVEGKLGPLVRDINILGNLFTTMKNIVAASDTFELSEKGGCGKGQLNIRSCFGGPHILIKETLVGGVS